MATSSPSVTTATIRAHWLMPVLARAGYDTSDVSIRSDEGPAEAWSALIRACELTEEQLARLVASHFDVPVADLDRADSRALRLVPERVAARFCVLPLKEDSRTITIATSDPRDLETEEAIQFASGRHPRFEVASPGAISEAIESSYAPTRAIGHLLKGLDRLRSDGIVRVLDPHGPEAVAPTEVESGPVVKLTNVILRHAAGERASDIHLEPATSSGVVRFRVDGVLRAHMTLPAQALDRVVSRIKIIANLDITDRLRPQDGRARLQIDERLYDIRVSTVPTRESEKAVVRLLDPQANRALDDLALPPHELARFRRLLGCRNGIVLVTGPTGSGKTTSIYAAITELARTEINIMSVEDPVEYEIRGVTQIEVDARQQVTFASALRAILRQDPDVIFIGEIRDRETAEIAVQASMTGHLVLATLHANDAAGAVPRLLDIGLDAPSIAATLRGVVAQRLLRKLCPQCSTPAQPNGSEEDRKLAQTYGLDPPLCASGCGACGHTGYRGRLAVAEILVAGPKLQELITRGAGKAELERQAAAGGMRRMVDVALEKAAAGETTLAEVERVLDDPQGEAPAGVTASHALVVDDDPINRMVVRKLLSNSGFQVSEASDGIEALACLERQDEIALIVLDLEMPRMGGVELLSRLKASLATAGIPVIVLTGSEDRQGEARLIDQGADDYIEKPVDANRFLARVRATLRRSAG